MSYLCFGFCRDLEISQACLKIRNPKLSLTMLNPRLCNQYLGVSSPVGELYPTINKIQFNSVQLTWFLMGVKKFVTYLYIVLNFPIDYIVYFATCTQHDFSTCNWEQSWFGFICLKQVWSICKCCAAFKQAGLRRCNRR